MNVMDALTKLPTITPTIITSVSESVSKSVSSSVISSVVSSVVSSTDRATITSLFTPLPTYTSATTIVSGGSTTVISLPSVVPVAPIYQHAGQAGQRTLWVVFAIMLIASIVFTAMSWSIPVGRRLYHIITTLIVMFATMSYFAMATGHGISYHKGVDREQHSHRPDTIQTVYRQVYWARYVDWALTTPLLLLDLCLVAGLNGANITMAVVADEIMILTGLFAAFGNEGTPQKWCWYAMACIAYLVVVWHLAVHGRAMAMSKGGKLAGFFGAIGGFTLILWTAYPVVWGVADGSRKASVDAEIIAYAILDVLAKPVFGIWLLLTHMNMQETNVDIGGFWSHGFNSEGSIRVGDDDEGA